MTENASLVLTNYNLSTVATEYGIRSTDRSIN